MTVFSTTSKHGRIETDFKNYLISPIIDLFSIVLNFLRGSTKDL